MAGCEKAGVTGWQLVTRLRLVAGRLANIAPRPTHPALVAPRQYESGGLFFIFAAKRVLVCAAVMVFFSGARGAAESCRARGARAANGQTASP